MKLSAIIITRNEERDLPECLKSLTGLAEEIVVVDSRSTDRTREVALSLGARVVEKDFSGYGPQKQFALSQAKGEWVLNIDADERVSPALAREIREALQTAPPAVGGFWVPFELIFLGKRLRFGGCGGEKHLRLFRRGSAHYAGQMIHEGITVKGDHRELRNVVVHVSYRNLDEYLSKCREYTGLIAQKKFTEGKRFHAWHHGRLPWEFFVRYIVKLGFLDGSAGFTYAALSSVYAWLKHLRMLDMDNKNAV